jgi:flagellar motor switch/type III secretory pathway protein FliN
MGGEGSMSATDTDAKPAELSLGHHALFSRNRENLPWVQRIEDHPTWHVLAKVPQTVTALISLPGFTVHDLLTLEKGRVFESNVMTTEMIPIRIGSVRIAWGEFEVVEHTLALRVTKLA